MKRFTETNKWNDPWYRKLSPQAKHLLNYLRDKCDCAGVVEIDYEAVTFHVGEPIQEQHLAELESRLQRLPNGKVLMPKFVGFQYGVLSDTCPAHKPVLKLVSVHGLDRVGLEYRYPNATLALPLETSTKIPIDYPSVRVQEKEKEKEKEEEGVQGEGLTKVPVILNSLGDLFLRPGGERHSYEEERLALQVLQRAGWEQELVIIAAWFSAMKPEDRKYRPQSMVRLLSEWQSNLDRARNAQVAAPVKKFGVRGVA